MTNDDLPEVFLLVDASAVEARSRHFSLQRAELLAILAGAFAVEIHWVFEGYSLSGLSGAALLATALAVRFLGTRLGNEHRWHTQRSSAEAMKAEAWRFAVGAGRYAIQRPVQAAGQDLAVRLEQMDGRRAEELTPDAFAPTSAMIGFRGEPLASRQQRYLEQRLMEQRDWYVAKAAGNARAQSRWSRVVVGAEAVTVVLAVAQAVGWFTFGWAAVLGAAAAAALAWLQANQYSYLATGYRLAAEAITEPIEELGSNPPPEEVWPELVERAERNFAREQGLWANRLS